jgi:glucose/mannose transport system substrate-binding protein
MARAVADLAQLLTYANPRSANQTWSPAAHRLLAGDAAMTIMGDWAKGYMVSRLAQPDVDFGAVPTPGTRGAFVFTTDTFGLPKGAPNRSGAIDLLTQFGSIEGQDTFNHLKGSIAARTDSDTSKYDRMARSTSADFRQASAEGQLFPATAALAPPDFINDVDEILSGFMRDGDQSKVVHGIANRYDILAHTPLR